MARRFSIATKLFLTYFLIAGAALAFAGAAGYLQFRSYVNEEADASLENQARLAAEMFRPMLAAPLPDRAEIAREGDRIGANLDTRLTLVLPGGEVVADSQAGSARVTEMENHADRPEIRDAFSGRTGVSVRRSLTLGESQRYSAVPIREGGRVLGVVRTSIPVSALNRRLGRVRTITIGTMIGALLLMLLGTAIRARRVTEPLNEIKEAAQRFTSGDLSRRIHVRTGDELEEVATALNQAGRSLAQTIRQLDAERARLSTLLENLSEGVIVIAADRSVRMMNRAASEMLDLGGAPARPRPYGEVVRHPDLLRIIGEWRKGNGMRPEELLFPSRTGDRTVRVTATRVRYREGDVEDLLLTLQDVTEERRLSKIKSDFVSNASHELRTPLTNIRGYLEAMQDALKEQAPLDPSFLAVAHENALRMESLVSDLLALSRAESGHAPLEFEEMPVSRFLDRIAALHRPAAEAAGKTLRVEAGEGLLRADGKQLSLALSNLVDNAIKYGKAQGVVTLSGRVETGECVLAVSDDGPGIPPEHLPRIFERFYRIDKGRSRELGGTGLGLSIAKHIVEAHGGTISVDSRLGEGTSFRIRIPDRPSSATWHSP